jgi:hypothetical protein
MVGIGLVLGGGARALADANGADFESFALGDVHGQNGWTSGHGSSTCPLYDVGVVSNTYGYPSFGARSLRISNAITCGSFNDMTFSKSLTDEAGEASAPASAYSGGSRQPYFEAQWDFASTVPGAEQVGLSVVASADPGDPSRMSWLQMQDTPTGLQLNFEDYQHSIMDFVTTPIATGLDRTVPHTVKMTINFIDGASNDVVKVYLDGALIHTGTTWEDYFRDFAGGLPHAVDSMMFRTAGTAAPANSGKGFLIDNFSSSSGPVPMVAPPPSGGSVNRQGTITVVKTVINDNGGVKTVSDFPLFVNGTLVVSGEPNSFRAPASAYAVTENPDPLYNSTFSGDCSSDGLVGISPGDAAICVVTNDDIGEPMAVSPEPPMIDVVKVPSPLALPKGPGMVDYTYTLRNIGAVPVTDVTMVGDTCSPIILASGDTNSDTKLDVNETWVYKCSKKLTETHTNTVVATGWANGHSAVDIASSTVVVGKSAVPPLIHVQPFIHIHVTKVPTPLKLPVGGGVVTYTKKVTNPGTVPLSNIHLTDDKCGPVKYISGDKNRNSKLDPNETWIYTCRANLTKTTTNTVTATGEANGMKARDIAVATVSVAAFASASGQQVQTIAMDLGMGSRGNNVTTLQQFLTSQNKGPAAEALAKAGATAYFGNLTRAALVEFQVKVGIRPALGNFGAITRAYLRSNY